MNEVEQKAVTLEEVLETPSAEGEEGTSSEETEKPEETPKEPEKPKEEIVKESPVPYDRFKEINDELKATRQEIQELKTKGKEEGLSEEERKELAAKEYIQKTALEAYNKMVEDNATIVAKREKEIGDEIKFFNSVDKDFTEKVAEDIGNRYGADDNPISVKVAYNIFKNEKELKSKIPTLKPKLPNPIRSNENVETGKDEDKGKSFWQVVQEAKNSLSGKK